MNDEKLYCAIMDKVCKCYEITDTNEIRFFEYLVSLGIYFRKDFNKSIQNIQKDTGVGKSAQRRYAEKFCQMGFLETGIGEFCGNPHHSYRIRFDVLSNPAVLSKIMRPGTELYEKNIKLFRKLASQQSPRKTKEQAATKKEAQKLYDRLCDTVVRRNKMYNDGEIVGETKKILPTDTKLPHSPRVLAKLAALLKVYDVESVNNAFVAFYDEVLREHIKPRNSILEYFWVYDEEKGYDVVNRHLNLFNIHYSYAK